MNVYNKDAYGAGNRGLVWFRTSSTSAIMKLTKHGDKHTHALTPCLVSANMADIGEVRYHISAGNSPYLVKTLATVFLRI